MFETKLDYTTLKAPWPELLAHFKTMYALSKALEMNCSNTRAYACGNPMGEKVRTRVEALLEKIRAEKLPLTSPQTPSVGNVDPYFGLRLMEMSKEIESLKVDMKETKETFDVIRKWIEATESRLKSVVPHLGTGGNNAE